MITPLPRPEYIVDLRWFPRAENFIDTKEILRTAISYNSGLVAVLHCDHRWVGGDLRSDFICDECGLRRDIEDYDACHCGKPIHFYEDGFSRGLCEECSTVRCDLPLEEGRHECYDLGRS